MGFLFPGVKERKTEICIKQDGHSGDQKPKPIKTAKRMHSYTSKRNVHRTGWPNRFLIKVHVGQPVHLSQFQRYLR